MPPPPLVICFGDSLTVGYQSPAPGSFAIRETPYGDFLQERLGARATVRVSGICGEVTGEMVLRFRTDVLQPAPRYVVILGGTNDLGWNAEPAEIFRNLTKIYEQACAAEIQPVAVTVPSIRADDPDGGGEEGRAWLDGHIVRRQLLNGLIAEYAATKGLPCVDLFRATSDPQTLRLMPQYSNDGLHLTTAGYRRLADLLYEQVFASAFAEEGKR